MKEINPEYFDKLVNNCAIEFRQHYPKNDSIQFVSDMGSIMILMHSYSAPVSTLEFREALRACANILEVLYNNETN